jgi:hypothetical protein
LRGVRPIFRSGMRNLEWFHLQFLIFLIP